MALSKPSPASSESKFHKWPSDRGRSKSGRRGADPLDMRHAGALAAVFQSSREVKGHPFALEGEFPKIDWPRKLVQHVASRRHSGNAEGSDIPSGKHLDGETRITLRHTGFNSPELCTAPAPPGRRASSGSRKSWLRSVRRAAPSPDWRARRARVASSGCRRVDRVTAGRRDGTPFAARPRKDRSVTEAKGPPWRARPPGCADVAGLEIYWRSYLTTRRTRPHSPGCTT